MAINQGSANFQDSQLYKSMLEMQQSPIDHLVLSGGGARGVMYLGMQQALIDGGILDGVSRLAGSSIGALASTMIATGTTPEELERFSSQDIDPTKVIGKEGFVDIFGTLEELSDLVILKDKDVTKLINKGMDVISDVDLLQIQENVAKEKYSKVAKLLIEDKLDKIFDFSVEVSDILKSKADKIDKFLSKTPGLLDAVPIYDRMVKTIGRNVSSFVTRTEKDGLKKICDKRIIELEKEAIGILDKQQKNDKKIKNNEIEITKTKQEITGTNGAKFIKLQLKLTSLRKSTKTLYETSKILSEQQQDLADKTALINSLAKNGKEVLKSINDKNGHISFKDLATLSTLDPQKFKNVVIMGVNCRDGSLKAFSAEESPDVELALATKASISIPGLFKPVEIDGVQYVDGGYRNNVPVNHVKKWGKGIENDIEDITNQPEKIAQAKLQGRMLAFAFGDVGKAAICQGKGKLYKPNKLFKFIADIGFKKLMNIGGKQRYTEDENKTYEDVRKKSGNVIALDSGSLGILDFISAGKQQEFLKLIAYNQIMGYLDSSGIGKIDPNYKHQGLLLEVYRKIQHKNIIQAAFSKLIPGKGKKNKALLAMCDPKNWKGKDKSQILKQYIVTAAKRRTDGRLSGKTSTMKALIKTLNHKSTSIEVKKDFIKLMDIDIKNTKQFSKNKTLQQNIASFKFKSNDFKTIISQQKMLRQKQKNITKISRGK